ncbi:MAG: carboxymuconolactone decarboxylase family protein [Sphaerochaetaceae bacterium]|nr:carboxymuconolactone decarboxylase family protein [Sphaerochaetaceae bacterium]
MMKLHHSNKFYSIAQSYTILFDACRTAMYLGKAKRRYGMGKHFIERIMLAVTQVNGCALCSYAHTRMALEQGMKQEDIDFLLGGNLGHVAQFELEALLFAQHYADTGGKPSKAAWERILETYGKHISLGILAAIRIIMVGNVYGIAWGAFILRLKGDSDARSSLWYELLLLLTLVPFSLIAIIHSLAAMIIKLSLVSFNDG